MTGFKAPVTDGGRVTGLEEGACVGVSPYHADLFHGTRKDQLLAYQLYCQSCPAIEACAQRRREVGYLAQGSLWAGQISAPRDRKPRLRPEAAEQKPKPPRKPGTSAYRGVSWSTRMNTWVAHLRVGDKVVYVGSFPGTPEGEVQAAKAWDECAAATRGDNTFLNFPPKEGRLSKYRGVSWQKRDGRWVVRIRLDGKLHFVGTCPGTPEGEIQAALMWDEAAVAYRGPDTELNFPVGGAPHE